MPGTFTKRHADKLKMFKWLPSFEMFDRITMPAARCFAGYKTLELDLSNLSGLGEKAAVWISKNECDMLYLDGLTELDSVTAECLCPYKGWIFLGGMRSMASDTAKALSSHTGLLCLPNLEELTPDTALCLAMHSGPLNLGISNLDAETAKALSTHQNDLYLKKLDWMCQEAAIRLSGHRGKRLNLPDFYVGFTDIVAELSKHQGDLVLDGIERVRGTVEIAGSSMSTVDTFEGETNELHLDTIEAVAGRKGGVRFNGMERMDPWVASGIAGLNVDSIMFPKLRRIGPSTASALAAFKGRRIDLSGLQGISQRSAARLSEFKGSLVLSGLKRIDSDSAACLAGIKGDLELSGLSKISPSVARALSVHEGTLDLRGLRVMSAVTAEALGRSRSKRIILDCTYRFSGQAARKFAKYKGVLEETCSCFRHSLFKEVYEMDWDIAKTLAKTGKKSMS